MKFNSLTSVRTRIAALQPYLWYHDGARAARVLYRNALARNLLLVALLINAAAWGGGIFVNLRAHDDIIALHHNVYFGITLIGNSGQVFVIPLLGLCIIIANLVVVHMLDRRDTFFLYLFSAASCLVQFFLLLGVGSIILINFR